MDVHSVHWGMKVVKMGATEVRKNFFKLLKAVRDEKLFVEVTLDGEVVAVLAPVKKVKDDRCMELQ